MRQLANGCLFALCIAAGLSCDNALAPLANAPAPRGLSARAVGISAIRLSWIAVEGADVTGYRVLRRMNHDGDFVPLPATVPQAGDPVVFVDTDVQAETFYGYRVVAVTRYGDESTPSVAAGTRTPPPPGVMVQTRSEAPVSEALDPDGYLVSVSGPDTASSALGLSASHRFAPLKAGAYTVVLRNVASRCEVTGDSTRTITVADTGLNTLTQVSYNVKCRDPRRGRIVVAVTTAGDTADANGFRVSSIGVLSDATLPDSERVVQDEASVPAAGGTTMFDNLRPGSYEIELKEVDSHCTPSDPITRTIEVAESSTDTVRYGVDCRAAEVPADTTRPLRWRNVWSPASVAPGEKAWLEISLDATQLPALNVGAVQSELRFDDQLLRFENAQPSPQGGLSGITANVVSPGFLSLLVIDNGGDGFSGVVPVARIEFTALGAIGTTAVTRSKIIEVVSSSDAELYQDSTGVVEDTLEITGGGSTTKVPPTAVVNGPYSGSVGAQLTLSATGSIDADGGSIVSYRWNFGDNSGESTVTAATTTHSYAAAGTYAVILTVTDDEGATATATTTATITADTPVPGKPYVWRNTWSAPSATPGSAVSLHVAFDGSAVPEEDVAAVTARIDYDAAILQFVRAQVVTPNGLDGLTVNGTTPGRVQLAANHTGLGLKGVVGVTQIEFNVNGQSGASVATQTTITDAADGALNNLTDSIRVVEGTLTIGSGGGGSTKVPPVANANGPYAGTAGVAITMSAGGSSDPDGGSIASYRWNFGDNSPEATVQTQSITHAFATAGSFTVTLTVTDDEGATATTTATVNVSEPSATKPFTWESAFSVIDDTTAVLEILLDLRADIPETPSIESLHTWVVDSLKWNPQVLSYRSVTFSQGSGSVNSTFAEQGRLSVSGTKMPAFSTGLLQLLTVKFRIVGAAGTNTSTQTFLGAIRNTAGFSYTSLTAVQEGAFTAP